MPTEVGSKNPYRERRYQIAEATHHDDGSVNLLLRSDGQEHEGAIADYPPLEHIETRRFGKKALIFTEVELVIDGLPHAGHGYTVEAADVIVGGMLFAARQREVEDEAQAEAVA